MKSLGLQSEHNENKDAFKISPLSNIRAYIAALFMTTPSMSISSLPAHGEDIVSVVSHQLSWWDKNSMIDNPEDMISPYEIVFRHGIKKTLEKINNLNQIPKWWQPIVYYRSAWPNRGKEMPIDTIRAWNLPEKFDIGPKSIDPEKPVSSIYLTLGKRKFMVTPNVGKIQNMYMTSNNLVLETTFITMEYDKEYRLIRLVRKLLQSPVWPGEKEWFPWVTVIEM